MSRSSRAAIAALLVLAVGFTPSAFAQGKKCKRVDTIWSHPEFARFGVQSIALLPAASYDRNLQSEKLADQSWGAALRASGYRWLGPSSARDLLARTPGGDSLHTLARTKLLDQPRADSLLAPGLCQRLRVDAVLTLRIDRWEKLEMEFNQAGKPSTSVQLKAALVDSSGALLWSASGSETAEGPYHDPNANVIGMKSSGLGTTPVTGQGGAPSFPEVLNVLLTRWAEQFPAKPAPPATTP